MKSLGIDIGGTFIKLAAVENGRTLWSAQSAAYLRPMTGQLIESLHTTAAGCAANFDYAGLCVPGIYDPVRRAITLSVNVPGLMGIGLDDLVARALGNVVPHLSVINDGVAAATDVSLSRGLAGRLLVISLGTGVGAGVLDDGVPLRVEGDSPGHIGQFDVSIEGDRIIGPDGGAGSLEGYIGVPALRKRYGSTEAFLERATVHDMPIQALIRAIRICHAIYRPDHIVLVGGIGIRLRPLVDEMKGAINFNLTSVARADWTLSVGNTDFHAALGAARLAVHHGDTEDTEKTQ